MTVTKRPARARIEAVDGGLDLVLDIPVVRGLDAVTYPSGGTSDLVIRTSEGTEHRDLSERFEQRLDGGRVRVSLPDDASGQLVISGTLEARNPDGAVLDGWVIDATLRAP